MDEDQQGRLELELRRERYALSSLLDFARTLTPDLGASGILRSVLRTIMGKALIKDALAFAEDKDGTLHLIHRLGFTAIIPPKRVTVKELQTWLTSQFENIPLILTIESPDSENDTYILAFGHSLLPQQTILEETVFLESLSRLAGMAISNARLFESERERERLESELKLARDIQLSLLPQELPRILGLELAAHSRPSELVGGDYYDLIPLSEHELLIAIADVVGKGISAALIMSNLQAALRALVSLLRSGHLSLLNVTKELNRLLFESTSAERFVTAVFCVLDTHRMTIEAITCGHPKPIILHSDGTTVELPTSGIPLGIIPTFPYEAHSHHLKANDVLVFYTDGLSEAQPTGEERFLGNEGIIELLHTRVIDDSTPEEILTILTSVNSLELHDDLTVVIAKCETPKSD